MQYMGVSGQYGCFRTAYGSFRTVYGSFRTVCTGYHLRTGYLQRQLPAEQRLNETHMSGNNLSSGFQIIILRANWVLPDLLQKIGSGDVSISDVYMLQL